jgi:hypothetical protein
LTWAVNAPVGRLGRGELAGNCGGVGAKPRSGSASAAIFGSAARRIPIALQPISMQGQTGLNVAAGVASLDLEPVQFAPRGYRQHTHRRHPQG